MPTSGVFELRKSSNMRTICSECGKGSGLRRMARTIPKAATFAPIPSASVRTAMRVKPGLLANTRATKRMSCRNEAMAHLLTCRNLSDANLPAFVVTHYWGLLLTANMDWLRCGDTANSDWFELLGVVVGGQSATGGGGESGNAAPGARLPIVSNFLSEDPGRQLHVKECCERLQIGFVHFAQVSQLLVGFRSVVELNAGIGENGAKARKLGGRQPAVRHLKGR